MWNKTITNDPLIKSGSFLKGLRNKNERVKFVSLIILIKAYGCEYYTLSKQYPAKKLSSVIKAISINVSIIATLDSASIAIKIRQCVVPEKV